MQLDITSSKKPMSEKNTRIFGCIFRQKSRNRACPLQPRLDGKKVLVTGGAAGVGEFVTRGLIERGAEVITLSRGVSQNSGDALNAQSIRMDLASPESIIAAVDALSGQQFDGVICNSGIISQKAQMTSLNVEKTFAVNVLGHHLLYRLLIERNMLAKEAKVVMTSGEIYVSVNDCSSFKAFDKTGKAYARSKLGNLWQVAELAKRYPSLHPIAVHPGVVASGFVGQKQGFLSWLRRQLMISEEEGAQASLIGMTQNLPRGSYWHNTLGLIDFDTDDPAVDVNGAEQLWDELECLIEPYISPTAIA